MGGVVVKMSELDTDRQQIDRLTDVVPPPSFGVTKCVGRVSAQIADAIEILDMCKPIQDVQGGMWFGGNHTFADATFVDYGACRAFAVAARALPDLVKRIARLEADLLECREHLETEVDVIDGDYGVPAPNRAMQLVSQIDETLNGRPY